METIHMTPEDSKLHQEIMQAKLNLLNLDKDTKYSVRAAARRILHDLRAQQYNRFKQQYESGMKQQGIAEYWNRSASFVSSAIRQATEAKSS